MDPYPELYSALVDFAERGRALSDSWDNATRLGHCFLRLAEIAGTLRDMALDQRAGLPLRAEHLAFVNRAVHIQLLCGSAYPDGWYTELFFDTAKSVELDPTIADVHTQPTDESGNDVGRVLHVGTGPPRLMVVTVDNCGAGSQAYVGLVSSFYERTTEQFERLIDEAWAKTLERGAPAQPGWLPKAFVR